MGSLLEYDMVVIGSGPGGQKAAIAAAKLGKSVAVVEQREMLGGVCVNTGTIPSKTLREAVVYLTGMNQRELYGASYRVKDKITPADLLSRTQHVIGKQADVVRNQLMRNRVDLISGRGQFVDEHTVLVDDVSHGERTTVSGNYIVIATGTKPARPEGVQFDEQRVLDSDGILDLKAIPTSMVVVGAGVIGVEYASMFAAVGTKVTIVEKRDAMLEFCDPEIIEALRFHLRDLAVTFRFGEEVTRVQVGGSGTVTSLASGKKIPAETVMYSAGRQGQTDNLELGNAGLEADNRGRIFVDETFQTKVDHIYAVGDVIGFPALASTSMDQGRVAACHGVGDAPERPESSQSGYRARPPKVVTGQVDMLPPQRCQVREQLVGNDLTLAAQRIDGASEIDRVPQDDGGNDQIEATGAMLAAFIGLVAEAAEAVEADGAGERIPGFT